MEKGSQTRIKGSWISSGDNHQQSVLHSIHSHLLAINLFNALHSNTTSIKMKTFFSILALAVLAAASPMVGNAPSGVGAASKSCGNQVVACCNPTDKAASSGLLSVLVGPILGNGCLGVSANAGQYFLASCLHMNSYLRYQSQYP